jgi:PAS domain S-box-containing protein
VGRRLAALTHSLQQAAGRQDGCPPEPIRVKGNDEIALLAAAVNAMAARLRAVHASLERRVIENLPVGLCRSTAEPDGRFILANPAIARMFGYESVDEFVERPVAELYADPKDRVRFSEKLLAAGSVVAEEIRLRKRDGTEIWGAVTANVMRDENGQATCFDGMLEDITERKRAEAELKRTIAELEKFNRLGVGRELRMIELKREVNTMARALGMEPLYQLDFSAAPDVLLAPNGSGGDRDPKDDAAPRAQQ